MAQPNAPHHSSKMYHHHTDTYTRHNNHHYNYHPHLQDHHHHYSQHHHHRHHQGSSSHHRSRQPSYHTISSSSNSQVPLPTLTFQKPSPIEQTSHVLPPLLYPKSHHSKQGHIDLNNRHSHTSSIPRNPPHFSSGLRPNNSSTSSSSYTTRIVSPTSRASDLARYAMTSSKDEKPIIDSDGNARHRSQSISPNEERRSLPPLSSSPHSLSIDVELSRKRKERDGDEVLLSPSTPNSTSSFLMTPQFTAVEGSPNNKRRLSIIEHLALKEEDSTFSGPGRLVSIKGEEPFPWYKSSYDLPSFPHHQEPITVFPVQYQIYQQPNQNQNNNTNGTPQQGTDNSAAQQNTNSVPLDPTLSSMRSSVAPNSNGQQQPQNLLDPSLNTAPEIRFPDAETLASATASPSKDGVPGEVNTQAALAAVSTPTLTAEDAAALLSVPEQDDDGSQSMKKEQPFSRSPELRVSHKLAERKRRKEMKELFDELRDELPSDRGMKASKWEILSKAIDHIRQLKTGHEQMVREIDHLRREVDIARGGTGAYTHSYPTYNLAGTYPPTQNNFTTTPATTTPVNANAGNGQQQSQQVQQQQPQQVQQVQQQQQQQVQPVQQQNQQQQAQPDQLNQIKADVPQTTTQ